MASRLHKLNRAAMLLIFTMLLAGCGGTQDFTPEQVVSRYEAYLGSMNEYQADTVLLPMRRTSEGSALHVYQNTSPVSVHDIHDTFGIAAVIHRLLAEEGYPELIYIRRIHWDPLAPPADAEVIFDATSIFIADGEEWIEYSNDADYPVDQLTDLRSDFSEAIEYVESQS